jgi:hypothetical protein
VYGADSLAHATNLQSLGGILLKPEVADPARAQDAYRQALQIRSRRLGPTHRQTIDSQLGLGRALLLQYAPNGEGALEKTAEGERLMTQGLEAMKNEQGRLDRRLAEPVRALADHYRRTGRADLAAQTEQLLETPPGK